MSYIVYDLTAGNLASLRIVTGEAGEPVITYMEHPDVAAARHACNGWTDDDGFHPGFAAEHDPRHEFVILDVAAGVPA